MTEKKTIVSHSDLDEVNVPLEEEFQDFTPTRDELIQLVKFWAATRLNLCYNIFEIGVIGRREIRLIPFASRRIDRITIILGKNVVNRAIEEAHEEFKKNGNISDREWDIFWNGTPEQREEISLKFRMGKL